MSQILNKDTFIQDELNRISPQLISIQLYPLLFYTSIFLILIFYFIGSSNYIYYCENNKLYN